MPRSVSKSARTVIACVVLGAVGSLAHALEPGAATYLEEALTAMEGNYHRSSEVDWEALRSTAASQAQGARLPEDTYAAIVDTLIGLDAHSILIGGPAASGARTPMMGMGVEFDRLGERFTVVSVDPGSGAEEVGLAVGDEILEVEGRPFHPARVVGLATSVTKVVVVVQRAGVAAPMVFEVPHRPSLEFAPCLGLFGVGGQLPRPCSSNRSASASTRPSAGRPPPTCTLRKSLLP